MLAEFQTGRLTGQVRWHSSSRCARGEPCFDTWSTTGDWLPVYNCLHACSRVWVSVHAWVRRVSSNFNQLAVKSSKAQWFPVIPPGPSHSAGSSQELRWITERKRGWAGPQGSWGSHTCHSEIVPGNWAVICVKWRCRIHALLTFSTQTGFFTSSVSLRTASAFIHSRVWIVNGQCKNVVAITLSSAFPKSPHLVFSGIQYPNMKHVGKPVTNLSFVTASARPTRKRERSLLLNWANKDTLQEGWVGVV